MKVLNEDKYQSLVAKAAAWDKVASGVAGEDAEAAAAVTAETILEAINATGDVSALNAQLTGLAAQVSERDATITSQSQQIETLTAQVAERDTTIASQASQIAALEAGPATDPVQSETETEITSAEQDPIKKVFAQAGDDMARLSADLKKEGLL